MHTVCKIIYNLIYNISCRSSLWYSGQYIHTHSHQLHKDSSQTHEPILSDTEMVQKANKNISTGLFTHKLPSIVGQSHKPKTSYFITNSIKLETFSIDFTVLNVLKSRQVLFQRNEEVVHINIIHGHSVLFIHHKILRLCAPTTWGIIYLMEFYRLWQWVLG